jgi:hypothetical protein
VKPRDVIQREAIGLAVMVVVALFPPLWRAMWRQELRGRQRPLGKKIVIAVAVSLAAYGMGRYQERSIERLKVEDPELFERFQHWSEQQHGSR